MYLSGRAGFSRSDPMFVGMGIVPSPVHKISAVPVDLISRLGGVTATTFRTQNAIVNNHPLEANDVQG
jgi:hypothetical protein